uniref:DNA-repair protein UVH3, putative n=1 Tax=Arundo donax TaxID=35708 RepID=A0A0A9G8M3_ARUDO
MLSPVTPNLFRQFFKLPRFEVREQELLGRLADLGLRGVAVPAAGGECAALERRRGAVEDEDGADAEEEELADAAEEPEEVRVADHLAAVVPHRPHELHHPDARVHRHPLPRQGLHRHAPPHRGQQLPQPVHPHILYPRAG